MRHVKFMLKMYYKTDSRVIRLPSKEQLLHWPKNKDFVPCPCSKSKRKLEKQRRKIDIYFFRHNDLPWNIRKFVHNKLESVNLTHNLKYIDPWAKSLWSHTDIGRMNAGMIGCQVSAIFCSNVELPICRISTLFYLLESGQKLNF